MAFALPQLTAEIAGLSIVIEIGDIPVRIVTGDADFLQIFQDRYAGFVTNAKHAEIELEVELRQPQPTDPDADVEVSFDRNIWALRRGDFRAEWNPETRRGWIQQTANPYSIDAVLRIIHSLALASQGGFLLHSASAIRNQKAFLFAGVSGAGKTTISRLAPDDVTLLTDEISYVRRCDGGYIGYGTPFTGELAKLGENVSAPISALYLLVQGKENRIEPIAPADATRSILANLLFFAKDEELVQRVFHSVFEFVTRVQVARLTFMPDSRVWELVR
jgi:hypothetical protein